MAEEENILLSKWLDGSISKEELAELESQYDLDQLQGVLKAQDQFSLDTIDSKDIWHSVQNSINKEVPAESPAAQSRRPFIYIFILLIGIAAAFFYFSKNASTEIKTDKAEQKTHQFADGSKVILAPGSSINFNENNWEENRSIKLIGQAQFDVSKGTDFIVETAIGQVKVMGTSFEVFQLNDELRLSCFEGKVLLSSKQNQSIEVTAGKEVLLNKKGFSDLNTHSNTNASFLRVSITYDRIAALQLAEEFSRFYNIPVKMELSNTNKYFSGILILDNKEQAASIIAQTMGWNYENQKTGIRFYE